MPEYARLTTSALSAQTARINISCQMHRLSSGRRTVAEKVEEGGVLLDRLLDAENANLPELVVEDPLGESGLHNVGAVEAGAQ